MIHNSIVIVAAILLTIPCWNANDYEGHVLYVGGSGEGNYTSIQAAINAANDGDIIKVYENVYHESIVVYKSLDIIGIGKPVIEGGGEIAVKLLFHDITFQNFIIRNYSKVGIYLSSPLIWISKNTVEGCKNSMGICVMHGDLVSLENNIIRGNEIGVYIEGADDVTIMNNTIDNNSIGISLHGEKRLEIRANLFSSNKIGLYMRACFGNMVSYNKFMNNRYGIKLDDSLYNFIQNNYFIGNFIHAYFEVELKHFVGAIIVRNFWLHNYWDNWNYCIPKPIFGMIHRERCHYCGDFSSMPWINFDWNPLPQ